MDEMLPQAQIPQAPQAEIDKNAISDDKPMLRRVFDIGSWVVLFLFLPITVLVLLSQNSLPGSFFYPVKRGMEHVILAAASLNPVTSVAFRTDLTKRRFAEAQTLLLTNLDTTGLQGFVTEVYAMENELAAVKDPQEKAKLQAKINTALAEYQTQLQDVKTQIVEQNQTLLPTAPPAGGPTDRPGQRPRPTNTPVPLPTATPTVAPARFPSATQVPSQPPSIPLPTSQPTAVPTATLPGGGINPIEDIDAVQVYLQCLRDHPENPTRCQPPANFNSKAQGRGKEQKELQEFKDSQEPGEGAKEENMNNENINKEKGKKQQGK
ncbi:MAG: hypothetical protein HY429_03100 [Candidatus Levybacteria bacterium]|nr:hypothetical protein [Candidatus Levybacteria bacterium]